MAIRSQKLYRYGAESFSSKAKAIQFFSKLRACYAPGETITDTTHAAAVAELLQGHCERAEKIGCGLNRYFVNYGPPPHQHHTCFWIERLDGTKTDFGVQACMDGVGKLNHASLRRAIRSQVEDYRRMKLAEHGDNSFVSEFSGQIFPAADAHVDHVTPFKEIVAQFAEREGIEIATKLLTVACDAVSEPKWKEPTLALRFAEFHASFSLRIVSARENLSTLRRKNCDDAS